MPIGEAGITAIGGGISGIFGLINQIGAKRRATRNVRRSVKATKELADYTYAQDLEQWNRSNLYNTPKSQMQRLRDANLNPNLIYGQGQSTGNTTGQGPKYQQQVADFTSVPSIQSPNPLAMLSQFQDIKMKDAQIDIVQNEADIKELERNWMIGKQPETITGPSGARKIVMTPGGMQLKQSTLEIQKATMRRILEDIRSRAVGSDIKDIEKRWMELIKGTGVGAKMFPLLRLLLGR